MYSRVPSGTAEPPKARHSQYQAPPFLENSPALLMKRCCNSNSTQYEKNRRFRHSAFALGRKANGAKGNSFNSLQMTNIQSPRPLTSWSMMGTLALAGKGMVVTPRMNSPISTRLFIFPSPEKHQMMAYTR